MYPVIPTKRNLDDAREAAIGSSLIEEAAELAAGKATLGKMVYFPLTVTFLFFILFLLRRKLDSRRVPQASHGEVVV